MIGIGDTLARAVVLCLIPILPICQAVWIENLEIIILQYVHLLDENCLRSIFGS